MIYARSVGADDEHTPRGRAWSEHYCPNCGEYMPLNLAGTERIHECNRTPPRDGLPTTIYMCPTCGGYGARRWGCCGRSDRPHDHVYMVPAHELATAVLQATGDSQP